MFSSLIGSLAHNRKRSKLSVFLKLLAPILRIFVADKGAIGFVLHPGKRWGCNLDAFLTHLVAARKGLDIYILNLSNIRNKDIEESLASHSGNIFVFDMGNFKILFRFLLHSKVFLVSDISDYGLPGTVINLWHGIPLKNIGVFQNPKNKVFKRRFNYVVSAQSQFDRANMALSFNLPIERILNFGLPRHDLLVGTVKGNQTYINELKDIKNILNGRKLVLYAPTFRDDDKDKLPISPSDLDSLAKLLIGKNFVLGIRSHLASNYEFQMENNDIIDLSAARFSRTEAILECSDILITDFSSICIDFLLMDRPIFGLDVSGVGYSRGFLLDFNLIFPGNFYTDFNSFIRFFEEFIASQEEMKPLFRSKFSKSLLLGNYEGDACKRLEKFIFDEL